MIKDLHITDADEKLLRDNQISLKKIESNTNSQNWYSISKGKDSDKVILYVKYDEKTGNWYFSDGGDLDYQFEKAGFIDDDNLVDRVEAITEIAERDYCFDSNIDYDSTIAFELYCYASEVSDFDDILINYQTLTDELPSEF